MESSTAHIIRGTLLVILIGGTLVWLIIHSIRNADEPRSVVYKWILTVPLIAIIALSVPIFGPVGPFFIVGCAVVLSFLWTPHIGAAVSKPLTSLFDGGDLAPEAKPLYSIARARQKQGRFEEAIQEVEKQLERFPRDTEGLMLLAEIQAKYLKDLSAAEGTVERLLAQPGHAPSSIAFALYSMADWYIEVSSDPDSAKRCLQRLVQLLPNSEFSLGASQRLAHLGTREFLEQRHELKVVPMAQGIRAVGLEPTPVQRPAGADPSQLAAEYVNTLEMHPDDTEAREKLAAVYAEHYGRLDMAEEQFEQLIQQPNQSHRNVVRWLNMLADLQIKCGEPEAVVAATLRRIIDHAPNLASAELARNRIALLKLELNAKKTSQAVKLGSYEQNLGLKRGLPNKL